jgi:four helix bundle protein
MSKIPNPNHQIPTDAQPAKKPFDLKERALEFAVSAIGITENLPRSPGGYAVANQLARAGSAIGANIEEGDGAETKPDKRRSMVIARKEAREARYWLRVIERKWPKLGDVRPDIAEASELVKILSSVISKIGQP